MTLKSYKRNKDCLAWRCMSRGCKSFKKYFSIRYNSFFDCFDLKINIILKIIGKYSVRIPLHAIINSLPSVSRNSIIKVITELIEKIPLPDFSSRKLGQQILLYRWIKRC
ncbi:hypothetical protein DMUE_0683 [Dictyocoela muelleri]|nr:hypothetical protein DMUE_0683 [Dictyocoela muelleri]